MDFHVCHFKMKKFLNNFLRINAAPSTQNFKHKISNTKFQTQNFKNKISNINKLKTHSKKANICVGKNKLRLFFEKFFNHLKHYNSVLTGNLTQTE